MVKVPVVAGLVEARMCKRCAIIGHGLAKLAGYLMR